jgi:hypothetical protein
MLIFKLLEQWVLITRQDPSVMIGACATARTFTSKKLATPSIQSLKSPNHALFSSALSTTTLISFSFSFTSSLLFARLAKEVVLFVCEILNSVSCCVSRPIDGPNVGICIIAGTCKVVRRMVCVPDDIDALGAGLYVGLIFSALSGSGVLWPPRRSCSCSHSWVSSSSSALPRSEVRSRIMRSYARFVDQISHLLSLFGSFSLARLFTKCDALLRTGIFSKFCVMIEHYVKETES